MANNPWTQLKAKAAELVPPVSVMRAQATLLTEATDGIVEGHVEVDRDGPWLRLFFDAVVPALNGYRVRLATASHEQTLYPVYVGSRWVVGEGVECNTKDEFDAALSSVLGGEQIQKIVAALLAQGAGNP